MFMCVHTHKSVNGLAAICRQIFPNCKVPLILLLAAHTPSNGLCVTMWALFPAVRGTSGLPPQITYRA